ncbi:MAG: hypothetical protein HND48_04175 [Chloroflexi bacterium]|nr:hypothetical protein [Chloroflexota bacterium]
MADQHIIAVDTYGAQRIRHPQTGKTVSAYKLGYTSAVMPVLLTLYGENAHDVSPRQASYRYLQVDSDVVVRHGHILLTVSVDELAKAVQITRQHHRAAVYLWRDRKWWALPDSTHADYTEPGYRVGPNFDPTGFRPPSPSTGVRESAVTGITAERSQREEGGRVWWWLHGDTYPHRDLLKRQGARWSGKRKAWYFIGAELPAAIHTLVTSETQSSDEASDTEPVVESASPLLTIFGGRIIGKERGSNGDIIVKGENGIFATRTTWRNRRDQPNIVWEFDLPPQDRAGNPLPTIQKALQVNNALYSLYTRKWHFEQPDKVAALDMLVAAVPFIDEEPCTVAEAAQILGMPIRKTSANEPLARLFGLTETVYARHELETEDGKPIPTGRRGKVVRLYNHNATHGWSYDVEFEGIGVCWCFERELTMLEPIPGIKIEHGAVVPPGAALPPTDAEIKRRAHRCWITASARPFTI